MEKQCEKCNKIYNARQKKQKYCSVECQHQAYKKIKVERVKTICIFCGSEFETLPEKLKNGKSKYCCRQCRYNHQKKVYLGKNNPAYGKKHTEERKKEMSIRVKKLWDTEDYINKIKESRYRFFENNGYWPGTDEHSKKKRKETMIERYGVNHNWNGKYGDRKCDKTTIEIYGKTSADMLVEYSHYFGKKSDIEVIFETILVELNIPHQIKFRIYDKNKINFWFREYDFLILNTNILIEVDGDYWHGNTEIFNEVSDFQKSVQENDKIKEEFAIKNGYEIIRFWGNDIKNKKEEVKNKMIEIWQKLN
jgi:very-short-patch-repair endonuclease